jgi:two-component system, NtrC family, sensor histidine kinase AtoS
MGDKSDIMTASGVESPDDIARFTDSYASFNRVINTLQRQYIELKDEFTAQNERLIDTNRNLIEMTSRNLAATEFLDNILRSISAGVIAVDRQGVITHFNPSASLLLGIPARDPLGKHYRDVIPPGSPIEANALRAAESGRAVEGVEKRLELPDGTRLVVSVSTAILKDKHGRATGAVEVLHDLTKTKRMEQEIARLNTLAALGEMAAAVAHQVRNPLSGILGYGSLLKRDLAPDDPRQKLIAKITDGVETLNNTVTTLLSYTRNEELNCEQVRFDEYLAGAVAQFRRETGELSSAMTFTVVPPQPPSGERYDVLLDPVLFRQVLFNVLTNACEACRTSGTVTLEHRRLPRQRAAEQYGERLLLGLDETIFELRISDTGPGIPEAQRAGIFAPFFTTKDGGTGLGLAIAWKIIKAHGGDIQVGSTAEGGARFDILLPTRIGHS